MKKRAKRPLSSRFTSLAITLVLLTAAAHRADGADEPKKPKRLSARQYLEAIEDTEVAESSQEDHVLTVSVIPDAYLHGMIKGFLEHKQSGLDELAIEKKLRKLHDKLTRDRGKPLFRVHFEDTGGKSHFFLLGKIGSAIKLQVGGHKSSSRVSKLKPRLYYAAWQIFEVGGHKRYKRKMAYFKSSTFEVKQSAKRKPGDKTPIVFTLGKLRRYVEVVRRSEYELLGINVNTRQITLTDWDTTVLPPISLRFHPGKWKKPRGPEQLEKIVAKLEGKK